MARPLVESRHALDIRALRREGRIAAGTRQLWTKVQSLDGTTRSTGTVTLIEHRAGQIGGGTRLYFACPWCGRRCELLYAAGATLACRRCCGLGYANENRTPVQRQIQKLMKLRRRLGQDARSIVDPQPGKPKGMHWTTYDRSIERLAEEQRAYWSRPAPVRLVRWLLARRAQTR